MRTHRRATIFAVLALAAATSLAQTPARKAQLAKDVQELQTYALSMDIITRTFMTIHEMKLALDADPTLKAAIEADQKEGQPTFDEMAAKVASSPKLTAIVTAHGFTPRTLTVAEMSLIQTNFAVMALGDGANIDQTAKEAGANPANLKLMRDHKDEITEISKKYPMM